MMNQETIHIRKLTTGYPGKGGTKIVAKDIDATIRSGELTCLLGANGVGKSTLLRTLSAFQPPVGGEIEIMGKKLTDYTDKQLATVIGVVLTEKCSLRNMTVEEQGLYFVYLQLDEEGYKKQEVTLGASNGKKVQILTGLKAGDRVVTKGAYQVKLASASNAIPAHSHEH